MMVDALRRCLLRELDSLAAELAAYPDDAAVWSLPAGAPNSAGTLTLHMVGNLRHFIGATLGGTGYVRDRDAEFASRDLPREALLALVAATHAEVGATLATLDAAALEAEFPLPLPFSAPEQGHRIPTGRFLVHLTSHLAYHLGQVDYHRRLTTGHGASVGALGLAPLF
jgi:uncharacterized damage-inducible protein DinB